MEAPMKFAFALDGLIRSRTKGDGGEDFARKCIREIGEAVETLSRPPEGDPARHLRDALRQIADSARAMELLDDRPFGWGAIREVADRALNA